MKVVLQRVSRASVTVDGQITGHIDEGLMLLVGIAVGDTERDVAYMADKCLNLRVFNDEQGRMNRSLLDTGGAILAVSQFTLLGETRKGRRPSYIQAAPPEQAQTLYNLFVENLRQKGVKVACGVFGAMMQVELVNDGPVTLIIESKNGEKL
ncbi:MAG: D-tyrosyl-tRNA(Tyr) deacylase [Calditrichaeota bacterium]|nr:MAG: D-tyrosyl-tRNA(Tyr) deacylase [Calditrichota bacterium]